MASKHLGERTLIFKNPVGICGFAAAGGKTEQEGPLGNYYDIRPKDATYGQKSYEKAERKLFTDTVLKAIEKAGFVKEDMDFLIGGDLLNQIVSAGYSARDLEIPFLGVYGACSTMVESLILGSMLIEGEFADRVVCATSSHFGTAERQFRYPLELGTPKPPPAQNTATAAGATVLTAKGMPLGLRVTCATVGRAIDFGITDANNMGAAMAPAAAETIMTHFQDTQRSPEDYDMVVTGDLGSYGTELLFKMMRDCRFDIGDRHEDCGKMIYRGMKNINCGGSGCGCMASALNGYFLNCMMEGDYERLLFVATGALLSPTSVQQGESIPSIAHAVAIERVDQRKC